jgi:phenylalanyl-tRNA synthetase alpha subunit
MKNISKTPMVPVSWGELIDKLTILEIKQKYIKSHNQIENIKIEYSYLSLVFKKECKNKKTIAELKEKLKKINQNLWNVEEKIRYKDLNNKFDNEFISLAKKVYKFNDKRSYLKKQINIKLNSELIEEKSYVSFN